MGARQKNWGWNRIRLTAVKYEGRFRKRRRPSLLCAPIPFEHEPLATAAFSLPAGGLKQSSRDLAIPAADEGFRLRGGVTNYAADRRIRRAMPVAANAALVGTRRLLSLRRCRSCRSLHASRAVSIREKIAARQRLWSGTASETAAATKKSARRGGRFEIETD